MRKPRDFKSAWMPHLRCSTDIDGRFVDSSDYYISVEDPKTLREAATWLLKAADWLEEKEGEK
jgi:hypothetical protein